MTVDLNMMLDLRDLQVAMDVAKRAEMGWFDVEFTMYGTCFERCGKRYFRVSADAARIYDFIETSAQKALLPTNVLTLTKTCPVPTGMREFIASDVKKMLAKELEAAYSQDFFRFLDETAQLAAEDTAMPLLLAERDQVAGCFDEQKLRRFQELVDFTYNARKISPSHYQELHTWLARERRSMEAYPHSKDIFEKTFYAIAYEKDDGTLAYIDNAQKATIYAKKYALESQGYFVTPLYAQTYWYNYTLRLPQVHTQFLEHLYTEVNSGYMTLLKTISAHNDRLSASDFQSRLDYARQHYGALAEETMRQYGHRWGII